MKKWEKIMVAVLFLVVGGAAAIIAFHQTSVTPQKTISDPQSCFSSRLEFEGYNGYGRLPSVNVQKDNLIKTDLLLNTVQYADAGARRKLEKQIQKCFSVSSKAGHNLENGDKVKITIHADIPKLQDIGVEVEGFTLKETNYVTVDVSGLGDSYTLSDPFQYVCGVAVDRTDFNSIHILWNNDKNLPNDITIAPEAYDGGSSVTLKAACTGHDACSTSEYIDCGTGVILEPASRTFTMEEWNSISEPEKLDMSSVQPVINKANQIACSALGRRTELRNMYSIYYPDTGKSKFCFVFSNESGNEGEFAIITVGDTKADPSYRVVQPELYTYELTAGLDSETSEKLLSQFAVQTDGSSAVLPELVELPV